MSGDRDEFTSEFANTFKEWHYLIGGFSGGVVAGVALVAAFVYLVLREVRRTTRARRPVEEGEP